MAISRSGATEYTQKWEILHGRSLGTLIKTQEELILRTIFWPFIGKGGDRIHPELLNLAWSIPGHIDYDSGKNNFKEHVRTVFWP